MSNDERPTAAVQHCGEESLPADSFAAMALSAASQEGELQLPQVVYDKDGDCIEFIIRDEDFYAERMNPMLTVYIGRESNELVGSLVKGVHSIIKGILEEFPGFEVEVKDGRIRLRADLLVADVNEYLGLNLPHEDVDTLGGFVFSELGHLPAVGDEVTAGTPPVKIRVEAMESLSVTEVSLQLPLTEPPHIEEWTGSEAT